MASQDLVNLISYGLELVIKDEDDFMSSLDDLGRYDPTGRPAQELLNSDVPALVQELMQNPDIQEILRSRLKAVVDSLKDAIALAAEPLDEDDEAEDDDLGFDDRDFEV